MATSRTTDDDEPKEVRLATAELLADVVSINPQAGQALCEELARALVEKRRRSPRSRTPTPTPVSVEAESPADGPTEAELEADRRAEAAVDRLFAVGSRGSHS